MTRTAPPTNPTDRHTRCQWVNPNNPVAIRYHDTEWGVPLHDDTRLFEILLLETFQAGLSWECVLNKREAFRKAFHGFDPNRVADMTPEEEQRLLADRTIIRHRGKIHAAVGNARVFLTIQRECGSFDAYLRRWTRHAIAHEQNQTQSPLSDAMQKDLWDRGMHFLGSTTLYAYLQAIGIICGHEPQCFLAEKD